MIYSMHDIPCNFLKTKSNDNNVIELNMKFLDWPNLLLIKTSLFICVFLLFHW